MSVKKIQLIAAREYRQHVAKKSFWIGLLLGPLFFAFIIGIQIMSVKLRPERTIDLAVIDQSGQVGEEVVADLGDDLFKSGLNEFKVEAIAPPADTTALMTDLNRRISEKELFGYLLIGHDIESRNAFRFFARNVGDEHTVDTIRDALRRAVIGARLKERQLTITRADLDSITKGVPLLTLKVDDKGKASRGSFLVIYLVTFIYLLFFFMPVMAYGVTALRSVLEEKSSRIIEVLLSSVSPFELFMGKILGLGLVGLTQVAAYCLTGILLSGYSASMAPPGFMKDVGAMFSPGLMLLFLAYFILGFTLFLAMFTAIGSMVNTEQEAQHMQQPIVFMLILPMYATFFFLSSPDSTAARVVSMIPFVSPMIMIMRITALMPPWWEIALSMALIAVTIVGVVWAAARIFRIGILMYGKRPSLPEIVKWVRTG
ncbi:MAG: ABC transporter permease [Candidatus Eisenbacteria bacterium]|nr:ABC transporter permease [Candidatus Eisenbacteria bacterium]